MPAAYIALFFAIAAEVIATSALNASQQFTRLWPSVLSVLAYGVSFYLLTIVLKTVPVGIAYAMWAGLGMVLIAIIGVLIFGQKLDLAGVLGLGLIISGVVVLNLFSNTTGH